MRFMKKVINAKAENDFSLILEFNDGSIKRFDAKPYLDYEVFKPLKDLNYFKRIKLLSAQCNGQMSRTSAPKLCIWKAKM